MNESQAASSPRQRIADDASDHAFWGILRAVQRTWKLPILLSVLVLILCLGLIFFLRSALHQTTTYISRINFVFPGAASGIYPNGVPFALNEVIDPAVLEAVYDRLKLGDIGVRREDFLAGFSIRPFGLTESAIVQRYQAQLSDRRLTFAERSRIEASLRQELEQASRTAAELSFILRGRFRIPDEVGRLVVNTVPIIWSQTMIEKKGVLNIPSTSALQAALDPGAIKDIPLPRAIFLLVDANQRLADRMEGLRGSSFLLNLNKATAAGGRALDQDNIRVAGLLSTQDKVTGRALADLDRDAATLSVLSMGRLKRALTLFEFGEELAEIRDLVARRVRYFEGLEAEYANKIDLTNQAMTSYVNALVGLKGRVVEGRDEDRSRALISGSTIPQLSESFIDKIIDLAGSRTEEEKRHIFLMTELRMRYNTRLVSIKSSLGEWRELQIALGGAGTARQALTPAHRTDVAADVGQALTDLNRIWGALTRMEAEFSANRMGQTAQLYTTYLTVDDIRRADPVWNLRSLMIGLSLAFLALIGSWILSAFIYWMRSNEKRA